MRVLALLALVAAGAAGGDWNSLGKVPKNRIVKIQLVSGRKLTGNIRQVGPEGLQFAPEARYIRLNAGELTQPVDRAQLGHVVQVNTSSGLGLTGKLHRVDERSISLEHNQPVEIGREAIRRVSSRAHALSALVGSGIGAAVGAAVGAATREKPAPGKKVMGRGANATEGAAMFGLMGALAGAIVGVERTIYAAGPPGPAGRP